MARRTQKPKFKALVSDLHVVGVHRQRNGIGGRPFATVYFTDGDDHRAMMAIVPDGDDDKPGPEAYVVCLEQPENSFRGTDYYGPALREYLLKSRG